MSEQDQKPDEFAGKVPGEGEEPAEQVPTDDHGPGDRGQPEETIGDGPSGGAPPSGGTETGSSEAVGDGPSGGAPE